MSAISFGTEAWLAGLAGAGWELSVSERRRPGGRVVLRLVEDEFEPLELLAPAVLQVGVLATDGRGSGVFVPCAGEREARELLERVLVEVER